jgi:hypothetical protein
MSDKHDKHTPEEDRALREAAGYKDEPGNQTPNTPDRRESDHPYPRGHERHKQQYGQIPGNQTANTPDVNESEKDRKD